MLGNGIAISDVSRWLGHRNIQISFDTYSHMMPSSASRAANVADKAFAEFKTAA